MAFLVCSAVDVVENFVYRLALNDVVAKIMFKIRRYVSGADG